MITEVKVLSRREMDDIANDPYKFLFYGDNWGIISIYTDTEYLDNETRNRLKEFHCLHALSLNFWDVTDTDYERVKKSHPGTILFDNNHAAQVIETVMAMQADEREMVLVAHCDAGVSRSGAVGEFATDFCKLSYPRFREKNPCVCPNSFVLSKLRRISGLCPYSS